MKPNVENPAAAVYEVVLSGLELGLWKVNLRAADIRLSSSGQVVLVEFRKRPLTDSYIKSVSSLPTK